MPTNRSNGSKSAKHRTFIKVGEYLEKATEYRNYPGRLINGEMFIFFHGNWVTQAELDSVVKKPVVLDFKVNLNNVDKTKDYLHK